MDSNGVAPMSDPLVQQQMAAKYPARVKEIPARVLKGQAVPNFRGLRKWLETRRRRRSAGCGGLRGEFLRVVGEQLEAEHMRLLEDWAQRFLQGPRESCLHGSTRFGSASRQCRCTRVLDKTQFDQ